MAFIGPREDHLAIRELYASYSDSSCRADEEAFLSCWTDDGQWNSHIFRLSGHEALKEQWRSLWTGFDKVGFLGDVLSIEADGDTAACRCVAREIIALKGGGVFKLIGLYRDEVVRQDGRWLFRRRDYEPLVEEPPVG